MSDASVAVRGLFIGLMKLLLTLGGIILAVVGSFTGNGSMIALGIVAFVLGQVVHLVDKRHLDRQLEGWATAAVAGLGPVPPREVRTQLILLASRAAGIGGDAQAGFRLACREWAHAQPEPPT